MTGGTHSVANICLWWELFQFFDCGPIRHPCGSVALRKLGKPPFAPNLYRVAVQFLASSQEQELCCLAPGNRKGKGKSLKISIAAAKFASETKSFVEKMPYRPISISGNKAANSTTPLRILWCRSPALDDTPSQEPVEVVVGIALGASCNLRWVCQHFADFSFHLSSARRFFLQPGSAQTKQNGQEPSACMPMVEKLSSGLAFLFSCC